MDAHEELVLRLAQKRSIALGLSSSGYAELLLAVREDPSSFVDGKDDEALLLVQEALERYDTSRQDDDLLDDDAYLQTRQRRMARMRQDCAAALAVDPQCTDARLLDAIAQDLDVDPYLELLLDILDDSPEPSWSDGGAADAWDDVFARPRLRVRAAIVRALFDSARYRKADEWAQGLLRDAPSDFLGARHTSALALARLEDEEGFEALDARLGRRGDSWSALGRVILLYKLGRLGAARRALLGYSRLSEGAAYALLRPVLKETYMPDRPCAQPYSYEEASLAVHEADPVIVDVPDLPAWAEAIPEIEGAARDYARKTGYDW